ncbi:uncharacterized protein HGUI_03243 [Hanseniaspora guilliermondii]|uniref:SIT4-associating protein SAP190 n=1 Tax=Hanseniaspora guilliermondii TaxID=56406 RepID=A0A1L0B7H6_9ASCO|nr:uncharacterized protein HGUI_03243 [Hanseniaspora guilliermondii]
MNNNFWSRSRSMKGLNHLVDDCFLRIDENNKKEDEESIHEESDNELAKGTDNSSDYEERKPNKDKIHKYYDDYFFADEYLNKNIEYEEIIKTSNVTENKYRPNLRILDRLLKMDDLSRILVLQLVGDNEDFLSLEDYFSNPLVLSKLLDYILDPRYCVEDIEEEVKPSSNDDDLLLSKVDSMKSDESLDLIEFYRCAVSAVDIFLVDIPAIAESFLNYDFLIKKLWSMLDRYPTLANDASAAFLKINERLLHYAELTSISEESSVLSQWMYNSENNNEGKSNDDSTFMDVFMSKLPSDGASNEKDNESLKSEQKMNSLERYLHQIVMKENIVDKFIKHLEVSSFMDFLLKIISTDKPKSPTYVILLLKQQRLIEKLLDCLDSSKPSTIQNTATDFIKALITLSANSNSEIASAIGPNELTRRLVSPGMISKLGLLMSQGGLPLSNCVGIIIEVIRKNHSDYDLIQVMQTTIEENPPDMRDPIYLGDMIKYFSKNLFELCKMMKKSLPKTFKTPFGVIEPLGMDRFKVCELVAELLHCSNMALLNEPDGERIVKERDPIRRKKIAEFLEKNFDITSNDFDEDDEPMFDMSNANYNISKTDAETTKEGRILRNNMKGDVDELDDDLERLNIKSEENSSDSSDNNSFKKDPKVKTKKNLEGQGEVFADFEYSQTQQEIRENPVIGDMLKLAMKDNSIVDIVLEMLFDFPWNNFLHNVVFDIVQQILNGSLQDGVNRFLIADLFIESRITELIIAGDQYCQQYEETNKLRLGYMGHLTLIAEEVAKFVTYLQEMNIYVLMPDIREMLYEKAWVDYSEAVLSEAREKYNSNFGDEDSLNETWGVSNYGEEMATDDKDKIDDEDKNEHEFDGNYPDVNFRSSVDELMIGRHSEDIHIDIEDDYEDMKEEDVDSSIEYVNSKGEVVKTTVKDFLKMNMSALHDEKKEEKSVKAKDPNEGYTNIYTDDVLDHDDYIDPNDDGHSYAKTTSLAYGANRVRAMDEDIDSPDSDEYNSDISSDEEDINNQEKTFVDLAKEEGRNLCRHATNDNMKWDEGEQSRIFGYKKLHDENMND